MNIVVIGAGVVGVTTAYELATRGHAVTVIDRCESVASVSSFANAGLLSVGGVSPSAARGLRPWLVRGLWARESALRWRPSTSPEQWRWLASWWQACAHPHDAHVRAMVGLAHASLARLQALAASHALQFERSAGVLLLMRHEREFLPTRRHVEMLRGLGVTALELNEHRARELEPGLNPDASLAGGVFLPDDGVGNCRQFTQQMREICESTFGVRFLFNRQVDRLAHLLDRWELDTTPATLSQAPARPPPQTLAAEAVVLCTGAAGVRLVPELARRVPVWPVNGLSMSFALRPDAAGPRSGVVDIRPGITLSRLGSRLRVTGGFQLAAAGALRESGSPIDDADLRPLTRSLEHWFPGSVVRSQAQIWHGARPMLPDGPPRIGPSGRPGLWLNLGHGAHGWTLACGAAQLLAEQIEGRSRPAPPHALDPSPFNMH